MLINFTREQWQAIHTCMIQDYTLNKDLHDDPKMILEIIVRIGNILGSAEIGGGSTSNQHLY